MIRFSHTKIDCGIALAALLTALIATTADARPKASDFFPTEYPDPFVGEYVGTWLEGEEVDIVLAAQVVSHARGNYTIRFQAKLDMRATPKAIVEAKADGNTLRFDDGKFSGTVSDGKMSGKRSPGSGRFELKQIQRESPTLGATPPPGAIVLFDGNGMSAWQESAGWEIDDSGVLMVTPTSDDIFSKQSFEDCTLHVEFRTPWMPKSVGQQRGNSGVFLQDAYEVQVLDSFGLESYYDDCGAIYKVSPPRVNATLPPLRWQTYDIEFRAPRYDADGNITENGRMSVSHNGVQIHHDQELWWVTGWKDEDRELPHPIGPQPIRLQGHSNYVQYRNIWIVDHTAD